MWMTVISTTAAMCMAVRWRHSLTISAEDWPGSTTHLGFGQPPSNRRRISFAPASRGGLRALLSRSMWGGAHDRPANLDIPRRWKACRNDDSDSDGTPEGVGHACGWKRRRGLVPLPGILQDSG